LKRKYKIRINNIDFTPNELTFSQLENCLEYPIILHANIENFSFDNDLMFQYLNEVEKDKANKFKIERAKNTYILAHFLNHYFLNKFHFSSNKTTYYQIGEFGKPYYENNPLLNFNISHAQNMVTLAYFNNEIGIDIEHIKNDNEQIDLVRKQYFSSSENKNIDNNYELFYKYWTKKESILKAISCGISSELKSINTSQITQDLFLKNDIFKEYNNKDLFVWSWRLKDYFLSLSSPNKFEKVKLIEVFQHDIKYAT